MMKTGLLTVIEAVIVVVVGWGIGLAANAGSTNGLRLSKDHFHYATPVLAHRIPQNRDGVEQAAGPDDDGEIASSSSGGADLSAEGYQIIRHEDVVEIYQGDGYFEERDIFIDARDDAHYASYHIRGAFQLDPYYSDRYLDIILPACRNAERIIVYCNGGKCEDSKLAASELMEYGIDPTKIYIYIGGMEQWLADGLPCESGARLSDDIVYPKEED